MTRRAVRVTGTVQGVGFRPFVFGLAKDLGLTGVVGNDARGVFIELQGPSTVIEDFLARLVAEAPPMAVVDAVTADELPVLAGESRFDIVASAESSGATSIPPDTAVCADCLHELRDPADRRQGYAFIACTNCGPRYTITTGLPYDRVNTTMSAFELCPPCRREYEDPSSRRFHAQPTACARCGPRLSMPVDEVVDALRNGLIVAIKGIGGYHLACNAEDPSATAELRNRKGRGAKPFAVMVADLDVARDIAEVSTEDASLLSSAARPIVVLRARDEALSGYVAPGTDTLGVMLPYAPLHSLLFDAGAPRVLVMTSGNLSDEPICTEPDEAEQRLSGIADVFCHHDRTIHVACDDSVVRVEAGQRLPVRRSRGYAPLPVRLLQDSSPLLAVGGELKTTLCVAQGPLAWLSQHVGDTVNLETLAMLSRTADTLLDLQRVDPDAVVSDAHPDYLSTGWASRRAESTGVRHLTVQHHHAHFASLLTERQVPPGEPVLGFIFDGTGYGTDGTIWGGEILLGSYSGVRRIGHLRPISLPGGDAATRHPGRTALAHLYAAGLTWDPDLPSVTTLAPNEVALLGQMLRSGSHCTPTTSMGRLFDAVSSLLGVCQDVDYEAQAAIELEACAMRAGGQHAWTPDVRFEQDVVIIDPSAWLSAAIADGRAGIPVPQSARAFHLGVAAAVARAAEMLANRFEFRRVALSGGVFANTVLASACQNALSRAGLDVLTHRVVPPNDGGLALGQVAVAAAGGAAESVRRR